MTVWKLDQSSANGTSNAHARDFDELWFGLATPDRARLLRAMRNKQHIVMERQCYQDIHDHLSSSTTELGGLLLGKVYRLPAHQDETSNKVNETTFPLHFIVIQTNIRSRQCRSREASLQMEPELWGRAASYLEQGLVVVGWYHSHPNLGAFFSSTDRRTQQSFFRHDYSLGLVIDPFRDEEAWFLGKDSLSVPNKCVLIENLTPIDNIDMEPELCTTSVANTGPLLKGNVIELAGTKNSQLVSRQSAPLEPLPFHMPGSANRALMRSLRQSEMNNAKVVDFRSSTARMVEPVKFGLAWAKEKKQLAGTLCKGLVLGMLYSLTLEVAYYWSMVAAMHS